MYRIFILSCVGLLCATSVWGQEQATTISSEEAAWLVTHPDAVVDLSQLPPDQLLKFMEVYQGLTPEEQQQLRDNAGELQSLTPEEQAWALENPDGVRMLSNLSPEERARLLEMYRTADPDTQRRLQNIKP